MKKRRHHYVWRYYLKAWTTNKKIWCCREGEIFNPNTMGIAQKRDFYKLKELTTQDIHIINKFFIEPTDEVFHEGSKMWVELFSWIHSVKNDLSERDAENVDVDNYIDEIIHNFEEDIHGRIEQNSKKYLDLILNEDVSFFETKKGCIDFSYFIAVQLVRTEKMKSAVVHNMNAIKNMKYQFRTEIIWNVVSHILATNMSLSIYFHTVSANPFRMVLLKNTSNLEFITGDQPVINLESRDTPEPPIETELYYPVSPKLAILITKKAFYKNTGEVNINADQVSYYNKAIIENSKNQIFASKKTTLVNMA